MQTWKLKVRKINNLCFEASGKVVAEMEFNCPKKNPVRDNSYSSCEEGPFLWYSNIWLEYLAHKITLVHRMTKLLFAALAKNGWSQALILAQLQIGLTNYLLMATPWNKKYDAPRPFNVFFSPKHIPVRPVPSISCWGQNHPRFHLLTSKIYVNQK